MDLPPAGTTIDLHLALQPHSEDALVDAFCEVSNLGHPKQVLATPLASALTYGPRRTNETVAILRTVGYALPAGLHAHVEVVAPTTHFDSLRMVQQPPRKRSIGRATAMENATSGELVMVLSRRDGVNDVEPSFLRRLYKTVAYVPASTDKNVLGIADLTTFMKEFSGRRRSCNFQRRARQRRRERPEQPWGGGEWAMAYPTPQIFYDTGEIQTPDDGQTNIPQTVRISFGGDELRIPPEYATPLCELFAQLCARGISVFFASGNGVVGRGDRKGGSREVQFTPSFPESCPYATSVGGTTGPDLEVWASLSQGGFKFSLVFGRPSYHWAAAFPGISVWALNYRVLMNGDMITDGTSCSTPVSFPPSSSLRSAYCFHNAKAPIGFLNPWLYGQGLAGFNDITFGFNPGSNTNRFSPIPG
ncbi:subtilisin-like protein [Lactarius psammicola]|nr:subtilisin-like protein [Lactarius psammicola]